MTGLQGDVKVPGAGKVPKKAAAAGLVIVATLIGVYLYRKRSSANPAASTTAAAAAPADQYPADGTIGDPSDPYSTDPGTGATYGDEALGSGGLFGAFPPGLGTGALTDTTTPGGGPPFSTNTEWSDWVITQLQTVNPDINTGQLTDALGLYLNGQPVDAAQKTLIFDARAVGGDPPVAGPGNYPPNIRSNGSKGGKTFAANPVKGLKARQAGAGGAPGGQRGVDEQISWDRSDHATSYRITLDQGRTQAQQHSTAGTSIRLTGLKPGTRYEIKVLAQPAQTGHARAASVSFTTGRQKL